MSTSDLGCCPVQALDIAHGCGGELGNEVDVMPVLDEPLGHPRGVFVTLQDHSERALGSDKVVARGVIATVSDLVLLDAPPIGGDTAALQEADRTLERIIVVTGARIRAVGDCPQDGVQAKAVEECLDRDALHVPGQKVGHDMVRGDGKSIWNTTRDRRKQALSRSHRLCHGLSHLILASIQLAQDVENAARTSCPAHR
jgi:hypothetical protein